MLRLGGAVGAVGAMQLHHRRTAMASSSAIAILTGLPPSTIAAQCLDGYFLLAGGAISWQSQRQKSVA